MRTTLLRGPAAEPRRAACGTRSSRRAPLRDRAAATARTREGGQGARPGRRRGAASRRAAVGPARRRPHLDARRTRARRLLRREGRGGGGARTRCTSRAWSSSPPSRRAYHPRACAAGGARPTATALGTLGELHPRAAKALELPAGVFLFELDTERAGTQRRGWCPQAAAAARVPGGAARPGGGGARWSCATTRCAGSSSRSGRRWWRTRCSSTSTRASPSRGAEEPGVRPPLPLARAHADRRGGQRRPTSASSTR